MLQHGVLKAALRELICKLRRLEREVERVKDQEELIELIANLDKSLSDFEIKREITVKHLRVIAKSLGITDYTKFSKKALLEEVTRVKSQLYQGLPKTSR